MPSMWPRELSQSAIVAPLAQGVLDYRCDLITQAVLGGDIDFRFQAMSPVIGPGPGTISIRPGRVVLVIEDRDALEVLFTASRQARDLAGRALGPEMPPPADRPGRAHYSPGLPSGGSPRDLLHSVSHPRIQRTLWHRACATLDPTWPAGCCGCH